MKTIKIIPVKQTLFVFLFCITVSANAQKLPTEQQVSLRAPAGLKIDGKATEWDNKFQAYNHHTDFYYTIANDDNNLYLIVQATDPAIIRKIINGGITFTINPAGNRADKEGASITYPVFDGPNRFTPIFKHRDGTSIGKRDMIASESTPELQTDSFVNVTNNAMSVKSKLIRVNGIKNVDTLISVYNDVGIKTAALFDNRMAYTYELSVPLKALGLTVNNPVKFAYQLKINEVQSHGINIPNANAGGDMAGNLARMTGISVSAGAVIGQASTDFWAEYTLAK